MASSPSSAVRSSPATVRRTVVYKVVSILEAVAVSSDGVGVRDLARKLGLDKSAVSRLLDQLRQTGIVDQDPTTGRFAVGQRLFSMAAKLQMRDNLWLGAKPIVQQLVDEYNETCYLAVREGDYVTFKNKIDCDQTIRYVIELGMSSPLHAGAGGRAILSGFTDAELDDFLSSNALPAVTDKTIVNAASLRKRVTKDRQLGYSTSRGERVRGGTAVAAPYFNRYGTCIGSIVFTCPSERLTAKRVPEVADSVKAAAAALTARLGNTTNSAMLADD